MKTRQEIPEVPPEVLLETETDASTRHRVMSTIMTAGPRTVAELSASLELTPAAIRRHLGWLSEQNLIASRDQRVHGPRGRGRPAKVFYLTDTGRAQFRHAYDDLAIHALAHLAETGGSEALEELMQSWFSGVEKAYLEALGDNQAGDRIGVLVDALNAQGYVASSHQLAAGVQLCQHHCPVAVVAATYPELCQAETGVLARLLGSHIQRLATIAHGDGVCTTYVPDPLDPGAVPDPDQPDSTAHGSHRATTGGTP